MAEKLSQETLLTVLIIVGAVLLASQMGLVNFGKASSVNYANHITGESVVPRQPTYTPPSAQPNRCECAAGMRKSESYRITCENGQIIGRQCWYECDTPAACNGRGVTINGEPVQLTGMWKHNKCELDCPGEHISDDDIKRVRIA